jgi:P2-related tail formation protein
MAKNRVFCKRKSEVKDLKSYVELLEKKGILVDWWEEDNDSVCFEVDATKLRKELS